MKVEEKFATKAFFLAAKMLLLCSLTGFSRREESVSQVLMGLAEAFCTELDRAHIGSEWPAQPGPDGIHWWHADLDIQKA